MIGRVLILMLLLGCGRAASKLAEGSDSLTLVQQKGDSIVSMLDDSIYKARCDTLTFKALLSAYVPQDLSAFEHEGKWERSPSPCYPNDSASSISRDSIMSVMHHTWSVKDAEMADRLVNYGKLHNWTMGEGPVSITSALILAPDILPLRKRLTLSDAISVSNINEILTGFNGHLLASYLWYVSRITGSLNAVEMEALHRLVAASPDDPMYVALMQRHTSGDYSAVLNILLTYPGFDMAIIKNTDGVFGWGSAPASVYYLTVLSIIEGR